MFTIEPIQADDVPTVIELTRGTSVFKPLEIDTLQELIDDYFREEQFEDHRCVTIRHDDRLAGFCYFAPTAMTEGTWQMYWIVVAKSDQARGLGRRLLQYVEDEIVRAGGRVLFVETSGLPHYEPTRRFYLKHGYGQEAVLREFYAPGDDMVVFRKVLPAPAV